MVKKSSTSPDQVIPMGEKQKVELFDFGDTKIYKITVEPGWKWSLHLKPLDKTESCMRHHLIYIVSGTLGVQMDDGTNDEFKAGDFAEIPPGHDGWTIGSKPLVWLEIPHNKS